VYDSAPTAHLPTAKVISRITKALNAPMWGFVDGAPARYGAAKIRALPLMTFRLSPRSLMRRRRASTDVNKATSSYKGELEHKIDNLENWAHVGAAIVVAGVIIEYKTPLWTFLQTWAITVLVPAIGGILIAVGVGLEMLMGILASRREHKLRDENAKETAELYLRAEKERHARVKLEQSMADAKLLLSQRQIGDMETFVQELGLFPGTRAAVLYDRTLDALHLAMHLTSALNRCGWTVSVDSRDMLPEGVWVMLRAEEWETETPGAKAALALLNTLNNNNTAAIKWLHAGPDFAADTLSVSIGRNPATIESLKHLQDWWTVQKSERGVPKLLPRGTEVAPK